MIEPANSVVHIELRRGRNGLAIGSGVLYLRAGKTYVVTAWHNVTGRHSETLECLNKTTLAVPDNAVLGIACRLSSQDGEKGYTRTFITVPLEVDGKTAYYVHPQGWPRVDVVAIPIDPHDTYISEGTLLSGEQVRRPTSLIHKGSTASELDSAIEHIQEAEAGTAYIGPDLPRYLYAGDDIFILGYPKGITDYTGQPICKRATVASSPHLGWGDQPQFLVDCASREGMSGAPVIFYNRNGSVTLGGSTFRTSGPATVFYGIYVGRLGAVSEFEAQLGRVWKRSVIDEIIDRREFGIASDALSLPGSEISRAIEELWPQGEDDAGYAQHYAECVLDEASYYRNFFSGNVMKKINGRADPEEVRRLVKEYAEQLVAKKEDAPL
jgi:hypothetical protein